MDKPSPPHVIAANVLTKVSALCDDPARHQHLLELLDFHLQHNETPAAKPPLPVFCQEKAGGGFDLNILQKVRQIDGQPGGSMDTIAWLKAGMMGRFYTSHLKQYPLARGVAAWLWRNAYPIYIRYIIQIANYTPIILKERKFKRWQPLIKLCKYIASRGLVTLQLVDDVVVETPPPKVFPKGDQGYLEAPHDSYNAPAIYVAIINDGTIYGGTNLVLVQDGVICHDLYDFERDYTSEELHGRTLIAPDLKKISWLLHDKTPERIPVAASFLDACAANYAHWLTEVLSRIVLFCADERFHGVPIVVNDGLHKNIMESLFLVVNAEREIITLPIGRALHIDHLYLTSVAGYVPFERRKNKLSGYSHGVFNPRAFELIRDKVASFSAKTPELAWPEKIYLRRNSGARKVTNAAELEEILVHNGFTIVEPEKLTFCQQAKLFSQAKVILGSSGAALANILYAKSNSKIIILIAKHSNTSYWYWQNIACAVGLKVNYVFGEVVETSDGAHADFKVDVGHVLSAIGEEE